MAQAIRDVGDVAAWRLCVGCGACAYICPSGNVRLEDFYSEGIRPVIANAQCGDCRECLDVCPVVETDFGANTDQPFENEWGPVLEIWEGHAVDDDIRFKGSSGGALTALSTYCLEQLGMHGVLHIAQNPDDALRNLTRLSRTRAELLAATGSRYAPASVCDHLEWVEQAPSPCVIIGKPAEIAAVRKAQKMRPALDAKTGLTLSFFCAESPSTKGTAELLKKLQVPVETLSDIRYRGNGWPGNFVPSQKGKPSPRGITYRESWAFLEGYRPWSVHMWPDGTGELADISCGDPWYEEPDGKNPGFSLIVVRTERGREIVRGAMEAGYLKLTSAEPWKLARSQDNLLFKKRAVWGRLLAMSVCGLPVPTFRGTNLFGLWRQLPVQAKLKSTLGTLRRIISRKFYRRNVFETIPGTAKP